MHDATSVGYVVRLRREGDRADQTWLLRAVALGRENDVTPKTNNGSTGLLGMLAGGAKDIPRNASWLVGKALPHESGSNGTTPEGSSDGGPRGLVQRAGDAVRDAMPGQDSVEHRLARARESAERAQASEDRAVEAAERAHELTQQVDTVRAEEKKRLDEVRRQLAGEVDRRVQAAQRDAEERVAHARREAESDADRSLTEQQELSAEREEAAQAEAERAQEEAHERFTEATERLARARELADEAAALAQEAAEKARHDAERISAAAQTDRKQADQAVTQARQLHARSEQEAATVTRTVNRATRPAGGLASMSKSDLLHLAQERDVAGRSSMSKKQLVTALEKKR
jgi:DNA repair exonuclease SbcCD ATPase subunit